MKEETKVSHDLNCDVMTTEKTLMSTRTAMVLVNSFKQRAKSIALMDLKQDLEFQITEAENVEELEQVCISFLELRMILNCEFDDFKIK